MPQAPLKERILSRNFGNFVVASTVATIVFLWLLKKCYLPGGSFDHEAADTYFSHWGDTIGLFTLLFLGKEVSNKVVEILPSMRGKKDRGMDYPSSTTDTA
jgi:hypothetical protein